MSAPRGLVTLRASNVGGNEGGIREYYYGRARARGRLCGTATELLPYVATWKNLVHCMLVCLGSHFNGRLQRLRGARKRTKGFCVLFAVLYFASTANGDCDFARSAGMAKHSVEPKNLDSVIQQPGIYAFAISAANDWLPPHGYIIYIGQTGAAQPDRTLGHRVKEYAREKKRPKRKHVWEFLNKWDGSLIFYFAPADPNAVDLLQLEALLNDALVPPYSIQDFSPEVRARKDIWDLT